MFIFITIRHDEIFSFSLARLIHHGNVLKDKYHNAYHTKN